MQKYALLKENIVVEIKDMEENDLLLISSEYSSSIDITSYPYPVSIGFILVGNMLVDTLGNQPSLELTLQYKIKEAREFGEKLRGEVIDRIGAKNIILGKSESQVLNVVSALNPVGDLLVGGALKTARNAIQSYLSLYPEYSTEFNYAIDKITEFVG